MSSSGVSAYNFVTYGTNILSNDITINEATTPIAVGASITSLNSSTATNATAIATLNTSFTNLTNYYTRIWCGGYMAMGTTTATCSIKYQLPGSIGWTYVLQATGMMDITMSVAHPAGAFYTMHLQAMNTVAGYCYIAVPVHSLPQTSTTFRVGCRDLINACAYVQADFTFVII
jgi:hypothetical protein